MYVCVHTCSLYNLYIFMAIVNYISCIYYQYIYLTFKLHTKYLYHACIQLNPACRAARQFPGLTLSRLLMSLNDDDITSDLSTPNAPLGSERGGAQRGDRGEGWWGHNYEEGSWLYSIFQRIEMMCLFGLLLLASSPALVQVGVLYC